VEELKRVKEFSQIVQKEDEEHSRQWEEQGRQE
jgi:hypothetical protein